jgi:hypothetical protein
MNYRRPLTEAAIASIGALIAYVCGGGTGYLLGFGATLFGMLASWGIIRMIGNLGERDAPPRLGAILVAIGFLIKLPIWVLAGLATQRLGGAHIPCFLAGLALVYFGTVGRALAGR